MPDKRPPIKLTNRDFETIKEDLVNYAKVYYPQTYRDFSDASFGAMMMDMVAYVGDILSFYVDYQTNETFIDSAIERQNVINLSKQLGYKTPGAKSSTGTCYFYATVPSGSGGGVNTDAMPILKKGATLRSNSGASFLLIEDIDFSKSDSEIVVAAVDADGTATSYAIRQTGEVISGVIETELITIESAQKFNKVKLDLDNVSEIISVIDSEGNEYFEVEHLSQNIVYEAVKNIDQSTVENAPYVLREKLVPRRFTVEFDEDAQPTLIFGYGSDATLADNEYPDPSSVVLQKVGKNYYTDDSFDPNKLLSTDKFGVSPPAGTMSVTVRRNDASNVNVAALTVNEIGSFELFFKNTVTDSVSNSVRNSIEVENEEPINGQTSDDDIEDIRTRAIDSFAAQNRAVTRQDYINLVYKLPSKFGSIKRANVVQDKDSFKRNLNLYVIGESSEGYLQKCSTTLKQNLKTWISGYKMINDTIDILDGKIMNFGIEFDIIVKIGANQNEVMVEAIDRITNNFKIKRSFGEPIYLSEVYKLLNSIPDVVDTRDVRVINKGGTGYSSDYFDVENALSDDGRFISAPEDFVLELRYPEKDIVGVIV